MRRRHLAVADAHRAARASENGALHGVFTLWRMRYEARRSVLESAAAIDEARQKRTAMTKWRRAVDGASARRFHRERCLRVVFGDWYVRSAVNAKQRAVLARIRASSATTADGGLNRSFPSGEAPPPRTVLPARSLPVPTSLNASVLSHRSDYPAEQPSVLSAIPSYGL